VSHVVLICNYSADAQQSMLRFGCALHQALANLHIRTHIWHPPTFFARWANFDGSPWRRLLGHIDKIALGIPALLLYRMRHHSAVWHIIDQGNAGYAWLLPRHRTIITAHDCFALLAAQEGRLGYASRMLQMWNASGLRLAQVVVAVSRPTQTDLKRLGFVRTCVVHNALNQSFTPKPHSECQAILAKARIPFDRPFIFHVGGNQWYKNRIGVVRIFRALRAMQPERAWQLVLAGKPWPANLSAEIRACGAASDIHDVGTVSNATLEACYCMATAVIFPSLGEGFGWPVAEAQACGAVVVASDRPPLPEVGGDGALYADPENPIAYAHVVLDALTKQSELRRLALANARRFTTGPWARMHRTIYGRLDRSIG